MHTVLHTSVVYKIISVDRNSSFGFTEKAYVAKICYTLLRGGKASYICVVRSNILIACAIMTECPVLFKKNEHLLLVNQSDITGKK